MSSQSLPPIEASVAQFPARAWFHILFAPRRIFKLILASAPKRHIYLLAALSGFNAALLRLLSKAPGILAAMDMTGSIFFFIPVVIVGIIFGPLCGVMVLHIHAFFVEWTGRCIGGKSESVGVLSALGWSYAVSVYEFFFCCAFGSLFITSFFLGWPPSELIRLSLAIGLSIGFFGLLIWGFIIRAVTLSEAQQFSVWKGFLNLFLGFIMISVCIGGPIALVSLIIIFLLK